jgi:hypothetical protein
MLSSHGEISRLVEETGVVGIYIVDLRAIPEDRKTWTIKGAAVRAYVAHPAFDHLAYATTMSPDLLSWLPDEVIEIQPA